MAEVVQLRTVRNHIELARADCCGALFLDARDAKSHEWRNKERDHPC